MNALLLGATAMSYAAAAAFFFRYFRRSRDRLFFIFAGAFSVLSFNRVALGLLDAHSEARTWLYVVRLFAFLLILYAIVDKNRAPDRPQSGA